jgi:hypothetical protein
MKRLFSSMVLALVLSTTGAPSANGILGIGDCKAVKSKISGFESNVIKDLNYIYGLAGVRPNVNSAQGVKVYEKHQSVMSRLKAIQKAGKSKPKCFNPKQTIALESQMRWSINSYIQLNVIGERYWISGTLEYQPLGILK